MKRWEGPAWPDSKRGKCDVSGDSARAEANKGLMSCADVGDVGAVGEVGEVGEIGDVWEEVEDLRLRGA